MPNRLVYPTEDVATDNGGVILWKDGVFNDGTALKVGFLGAARKELGRACPGNDVVLARRALTRGKRFRALHESCYRTIMGMPNPERFVSVRSGGAFRTYELTLPKGREFSTTRASMATRAWCLFEAGQGLRPPVQGAERHAAASARASGLAPLVHAGAHPADPRAPRQGAGGLRLLPVGSR